MSEDELKAREAAERAAYKAEQIRLDAIATEEYERLWEAQLAAEYEEDQQIQEAIEAYEKARADE